ncbi:MAG: DUF58 domain-containing protein [Roseburia sp.]|nr:DUF58 domain-containing protein [Roseburia sp.]MCM1099530.1 DUF58 domain-containing protein [Ruminococcus flavefaciens]
MIRLLGIALLFLLFFLGQRVLYQKLWRRELLVDIRFSQDHITEGEQGELKEIIENRKRLPLAMLKVKFRTDRQLLFAGDESSRTTDQFYRNDIFRVGGRERVTRTLKFTGGRRGYYTIEGADLVAADLFLMNQMTSSVSFRTEVYVYPKPWVNEEMKRSLVRLNGEQLAKRHLLEDPFEYRGIREYQPYDDMRSINWKATAKTGDFKVNQKNYTSLRNVRIYFNIQDDNILKKDASVEMALRITAGLCACFLQQGIQTSCCGNGVDILTGKHLEIGARAGEGQLDAVCRALARLDTEKKPVSFPDTFEERLLTAEENCLICFVSPNQYDDFVRLLERLQESGKDFIWYYPVEGHQTPKLPPSLEARIQLVHFNL